MEQVKTIPLAGDDFEVIFKKLGLPYSKRVQADEFETQPEPNATKETCFESPIAREKSARSNVTVNFSPSPVAKHTFKKRTSPKARKALGIEKVSKKPERPANSKSKTFLSRFSKSTDNPFSDSSSENEDTELLENYIAMEETQVDEVLFKLPELSEDEDTKLLENYIAMENTQKDEVLFKLPDVSVPVMSSSKETTDKLNARSTSRTVQSSSRVASTMVPDNPVSAGIERGANVILV